MPDPVSTPGLPEGVQRLIDEGPISISAAAALCGTYRQGKPTHASTVTRWALKGYRLPGGQLVKLESFRLAGRLMTSRAALVRFVAAQNGEGPPPGAPALTPKARIRGAAAASRTLNALLGTRG